MWVYLAKSVLNIFDFCLAGGTYIEHIFTSCLIGVCTPLESLQNYTFFQQINKKTYATIYTWGTVVTLNNKEMFLLTLSNVAPAEECATFVKCAKNYALS